MERSTWDAHAGSPPPPPSHTVYASNKILRSTCVVKPLESRDSPPRCGPARSPSYCSQSATYTVDSGTFMGTMAANGCPGAGKHAPTVRLAIRGAAAHCRNRASSQSNKASMGGKRRGVATKLTSDQTVVDVCPLHFRSRTAPSPHAVVGSPRGLWRSAVPDGRSPCGCVAPRIQAHIEALSRMGARKGLRASGARTVTVVALVPWACFLFRWGWVATQSPVAHLPRTARPLPRVPHQAFYHERRSRVTQCLARVRAALHL
jgi:hypothetical protein